MYVVIELIFIKQLIMYGFNLYVATKFSYELSYSLFISLKSS